jgi:hypothetical protein
MTPINAALIGIGGFALGVVVATWIDERRRRIEAERGYRG